jgi:hypothetical protein
MALHDQDTVWIDTDGLVRPSEKAELHNIGDEEVWIPKSVIGAKGDGRIEVARWWAEKKGLTDPKDGR